VEEPNVHLSRWLIVAFAFLLTAGVDGEKQSAIASIALVLSEFVHTCTPVQREALSGIIQDEAIPHQERALAAALLRVHHVRDRDGMSLLRALAHDTSQTPQLRTVATVLHRL
jgi:hypothetical protein